MGNTDDTPGLVPRHANPTTSDSEDSQLPPEVLQSYWKSSVGEEADLDSRLASLLSASSYPAPIPIGRGRPDPVLQTDQLPMYGGVQVQHSIAKDTQTNASIEKTKDDQKARQLQSDTKEQVGNPAEPKKTRKKLGRPPLPDNDLYPGGAQERRQVQLRRAQRAYRLRKESTLTTVQDHAAKLQTALKQICTTIISADDVITQAGTLYGKAGLTQQIRDMTQKALSLAEEGSDGSTEHSPAFSNNFDSVTPVNNNSPSSSNDHVAMLTKLGLALTDDEHAKIVNIARDIKGKGLYPSLPLSGPPMEYSSFMKQLRLVGLQQAHTALANTDIALPLLKRPFIFLWRLMDRECMTLYYEAGLNAVLAGKGIEYPRDIPFYQLGGAGSHYPRTEPSMDWYPYRHGQWRVEQDPLMYIPLDMQKDFDGPWFDIVDLEEYLRENNVKLLITPPTMADLETSANIYVNVAKLIAGLTKVSICLGRSPGFQLRGVQQALYSAMWTQIGSTNHVHTGLPTEVLTQW